MKCSTLCLTVGIEIDFNSSLQGVLWGFGGGFYLTHSQGFTHLSSSSTKNMTSLGNKRLKSTLPSDYNRNTFAS